MYIGSFFYLQSRDEQLLCDRNMTMYLYWGLCIALVSILMLGVGYAEAEITDSIDKSPKHHLLTTPRNIFVGCFVVIFVTSSMMIGV